MYNSSVHCAIHVTELNLILIFKKSPIYGYPIKETFSKSEYVYMWNFNEKSQLRQ